MIAPRTWLTLALGALAGAGVSTAVLALRRGPKPCEAAPDDGGTAAALRARAAAPTSGTCVRVTDGHQTKERCLVDLQDAGDRVVSVPLDGGNQARVLSKDLLRRVLFRDLELFLSSWRPVEPPVFETVGGRALVRSTWGAPDDEGWARRDMWIDASTRSLVRLLDRTHDGHTIHDVEFLAGPPSRFDPVRAMFQLSFVPVREPRLNPRTVAGFDDFVRKVGIALYVPARLPRRMQRVDFAYEDRAIRRAGPPQGLPVAWVSYGDGVSSMSIVSAEPADLDEITKQSARAGGLGRDMGCPSLPADAPEDLVGDDGQIRVRRRTNGCLTVLRRDGLPGGVSVLLVCQGGMPADVPLELIRTLVRLQTLGRGPTEAGGDGSPDAEGSIVGSPDAMPLPDEAPPNTQGPRAGK